MLKKQRCEQMFGPGSVGAQWSEWLARLSMTRKLAKTYIGALRRTCSHYADAGCVEAALDEWPAAAGLRDRYAFRCVNRAGRVAGERLGEKVVWQMLKPYAEAAGVPGIAPHDLRRTCEIVSSRGRAA